MVNDLGAGKDGAGGADNKAADLVVREIEEAGGEEGGGKILLNFAVQERPWQIMTQLKMETS